MAEIAVLPEIPKGLKMLQGKRIPWKQGIAILDSCCEEHNYDCGIWEWQCHRLLGTRCEQNGKHGGWAWWKYAAVHFPAPKYQTDEQRYANTIPVLQRSTVISLIRERSMV